MDECVSRSLITEIEKLNDGKLNVAAELSQNVINVDKMDSGLFSISIDDSDLENLLSDITGQPDIDKKLSELQCPFTWPLPREGIIPLAMVSIFTSVSKDIEDGENFKLSR